MQLVIAFQEACKPFGEDGDEVVIFDTREVIPDTAARSITSAHGEGQQQHANFMAHHLQSTTFALYALIKMNTIHIPGNRHKEAKAAKQVLSSPSHWSWIKSNTGWVPFMTALPRAAKTMTSCTGKCSCYKKGYVCTGRCRCSGHCYGRSNHPPTSFNLTKHCCHVARTTHICIMYCMSL